MNNTPQTVTLTRLQRQKIGGIPFIDHVGTLVSLPKGARLWLPGFNRWLENEMVLHFLNDSRLHLDTIDGYAASKAVTKGKTVEVETQEFYRRLMAVMNDTRAYEVLVRDCDITTSVLIEGEPVHFQFRQGVGVAAGILVLFLLARTS